MIIQHHRLTGQPGSGFGFNVPRPSSGVPNLDFSSIQVPGSSRPPTASDAGAPAGSSKRSATEDDPAYIRDVLLSSPEQLALVKQNNPELAEALLSGNFGKFKLLCIENLFLLLLIFFVLCVLKCMP